jgi:hypothetical protein
MARRFRTDALGVVNPPAVFALVRGKRPVLTVRPEEGRTGSLYCMNDPRQLRALAEAILSALDKSPRAPRRKPR